MDWNDGMGYPQMQPAFRHIPKAEIKDALTMYIMQTKQGYVNKVWEVESIQPQCKHACSQFGLSILSAEQFVYEGITIPFWYCKSCGTLRVWLDYN